MFEGTWETDFIYPGYLGKHFLTGYFLPECYDLNDEQDPSMETTK